MNLLIAIPVVPLIILGVALCCVAIMIRRHTLDAQRQGPRMGLTVALEATRQHGWPFLNLLLTNHGGSKVWVEQATIVLSELAAEMQSCAPKRENSVTIRTVLEPRESLRLSLIESVYDAAGKPQGSYTFRASGVVRCLVGGTPTEALIPGYDVSMNQLSLVRIRRAGGPAKDYQPTERQAETAAPLDVPAPSLPENVAMPGAPGTQLSAHGQSTQSG